VARHGFGLSQGDEPVEVVDQTARWTKLEG
jgi:hypothetical protein